MNLVRTGLLVAAMTALFLTIGFLIGGKSGLLIALVMAGAMNLWAFWSSDQLVLRMHNARPIDAASAPDLHGLVADLARRAGLPMPAVYLIESDQPNAFATGRSPEHSAVAVTRGILQVLSREELAGVIAHELAHIKNRDTLTMTIAATIAGAIGFLANFAFFFGGSSENRNNPLGIIGTILVMILAPMAAMLVQMAISRTREYSADRLGAEICGEPRWLAAALQRIEAAAQNRVMPTAEHNPASAHLFIINPLRMGGVDGLFRTHPSTDERIRRLLSIEPGAPRGTGSSPFAAATPSTSSFTRPLRGPWGRPTRPTARRGSVPSAGRR